MMPILHSPGLMMPGQLGPINLVADCSLSARLTSTCAPEHFDMALVQGSPVAAPQVRQGAVCMHKFAPTHLAER